MAAQRRGRLTAAEVSSVVSMIQALPVEGDNRTSERALRETVALAQGYGLTTYDAA